MAELVEIAILAYRNARYVEAADFLEQAVAQISENWLARLYLAMSYRKLDRAGDAFRHLDHMLNECPEGDLKDKARDTLRQLAAESNKPSRDKPGEEKLDRNHAMNGD